MRPLGLVLTIALGLGSASAAAAGGDDAPQAQPAGDVVTLKDGRRLEGRIVAEDDRYVSISVGGTTRAYAKDTMPRGILGLNAAMFEDYVQYVADRRLEKIGLAKVYGASNPFPWMSEILDLKKEKNFFETRGTEDQTGGALSWE